MARSIKKGPFVDFHLLDKIQKAKAANQAGQAAAIVEGR